MVIDSMSVNWKKVGNNDLRYDDIPVGGFRHVTLHDADDGDTIVVNEDDIEALIAMLQQTLEDIAIESAVKLNLKSLAEEAKAIMSETELIQAAKELVTLVDKMKESKKAHDAATRSHEVATEAYRKKADELKNCVGRNIDRRLIVVKDTLVEIQWRSQGVSVTTSPVLIS